MNKQELEQKILELVKQYEKEHEDRFVYGIETHTSQSVGENKQKTYDVFCDIRISE